MATKSISNLFWHDPYVLELPPKGKLALMYSFNCQDIGMPIILEDMAKSTGIEFSECEDWVDRFKRDNFVKAAVA
jgi:hypothetical protein